MNLYGAVYINPFHSRSSLPEVSQAGGLSDKDLPAAQRRWRFGVEHSSVGLGHLQPPGAARCCAASGPRWRAPR